MRDERCYEPLRIYIRDLRGRKTQIDIDEFIKNLLGMESKGGRLLKLGFIPFHYNIKETINKGRWVEVTL